MGYKKDGDNRDVHKRMHISNYKSSYKLNAIANNNTSNIIKSSSTKIPLKRFIKFRYN